MKMAYADPPYLGCALKFYGDPTYDKIEAHAALIQQLEREYPDGWAYSLSSSSLIPMTEAGVFKGVEGLRIGSWVKPFHAYKKGVRPAYAWEPVIYKGGRNKNPPVPLKGGKAITPKDFVSANITLKKGLTGAKPEAFWFWLFDILGLQPNDEFVDIFPGTGGGDRHWDIFKTRAA